MRNLAYSNIKAVPPLIEQVVRINVFNLFISFDFNVVLHVNVTYLVMNHLLSVRDFCKGLKNLCLKFKWTFLVDEWWLISILETLIVFFYLSIFKIMKFLSNIFSVNHKNYLRINMSNIKVFNERNSYAEGVDVEFKMITG